MNASLVCKEWHARIAPVLLDRMQLTVEQLEQLGGWFGKGRALGALGRVTQIRMLETPDFIWAHLAKIGPFLPQVLSITVGDFPGWTDSWVIRREKLEKLRKTGQQTTLPPCHPMQPQRLSL